MLDSQISYYEGKIRECQEIISVLRPLISAVEGAIPTVVSAAQIAENLILAGESIDRGKISELNTRYNSIISNAESMISSYTTKIQNYSAEVRNLYRQKDAQQKATV